MWYFSTNKSIEEIKNIRKRWLRLTLNDHKSDYKILLDKRGKKSIEIRKIKTLAIEMFKTFNELKSTFIKTIFTSKTNSTVRSFGLSVKKTHF